MSKTVKTLADLTSDPTNRRNHTPRGVGMIEKGMGEVGAARSIVIDENGVVLAGNATIEAAAAAGIERVQVVDADGETLIAVRRSNLTDDQKVRLALYDNRTAELSDWNADQLLADVAAGIDIDQFFRPDELKEILESAHAPDWEGAMDGLPDADRAPFQQMTFTVHDSQAEQVKAALTAAQKLGAFVDSPNENSNGNALARICETFLTIAGHANS